MLVHVIFEKSYITKIHYFVWLALLIKEQWEKNGRQRIHENTTVKKIENNSCSKKQYFY